MATISFGSTHCCDDMLPFVLPLSACQSILPIRPTDNGLASPLKTQAAVGRRSIMDTSPQDQLPWPYPGTPQTTTISKQMFILALCFAVYYSLTLCCGALDIPRPPTHWSCCYGIVISLPYSNNKPYCFWGWGFADVCWHVIPIIIPSQRTIEWQK